MFYQRGMMSPSQSDREDEERNIDRPHLLNKNLMKRRVPYYEFSSFVQSIVFLNKGRIASAEK
jgi:hypothetical protein